MLLVAWYEIDWFLWNPIIICALLLFILFIRILRKTFRWKCVDVQGIIKTQNETGVLSFCEYSQNLLSGKSKTMTGQSCNILLIPSFFAKKKKFDALASSLAIYGLNVHVCFMEDLIGFSHSKSPKAAINELKRFFTDNNFRSVVAFDVGFSFCLHGLGGEFFREVNCDLIGVRPLFDLSALKSVLNPSLWRSVCGTLFRFKLAISPKFYAIRKIIEDFKHSSDTNEFLPSLNGFLSERVSAIFPNVDLQSRKYLKLLSNSESNHIAVERKDINFCSVKILSRGGWSFHHQEPLVLSFLIEAHKFIRDRCFKKLWGERRSFTI